MQPPTDGPRAGFTVAQVSYLIENTSSFDTTMGMQLINQNLDVLDDLSYDLHAATVSRSNYANIHGSLTFTIDRPLSWGNSIVRPYMELTGPIDSSGDTATMRFYLGAYLTDTPQEDLSQVPSSFDATGYDILSLLDDAIGDAYSIDVGVAYLDRVEEILLNRGFTQYIIDQDQAAATVTSALTYTLDDNVTWLTVVNDLLAAVGYQGIWSDHNGVLRCHVYTSPADRASEWTLTDDPAVTLLTERKKRQRDYYDSPNHWVFYQNTSTESDQASTDNGLRYEYTNQYDGPTSVEARGGRIITKVTGVDAADAASLQSQAQVTIDADMLVPLAVSIETAPFPLAYHFDRYTISDADLGAALEVVASSWSLNLDGSDMTHEWTALN